MILLRSLLFPVLAAGGLGMTAVPLAAEAPDHALGELITQALRAEGPFFTGDEQAVINRACGYAPGEWDGFELNMHDDVLHCTNGREVDDPEVRRMMRRAGSRIARRVSAVMARPDVREAIDRIAEQATEEAMRELARNGFQE